MAQVDNARPVPDHHPMNKSRLSTASAMLLHGERGETGVYDGKTEPLGANALRRDPNKHLNA